MAAQELQRAARGSCATSSPWQRAADAGVAWGHQYTPDGPTRARDPDSRPVSDDGSPLSVPNLPRSTTRRHSPPGAPAFAAAGLGRCEVRRPGGNLSRSYWCIPRAVTPRAVTRRGDRLQAASQSVDRQSITAAARVRVSVDRCTWFRSTGAGLLAQRLRCAYLPTHCAHCAELI